MKFPFDININTLEGQLEVLRLWSAADIDLSTAALILKSTTRDVLSLAGRHGFAPPDELVRRRRIRELEARVRPQLRRSKRQRGVRNFDCLWTSIAELMDLVASIALEANAYGDKSAHQCYSVAHAQLRLVMDELASANVQFEAARRLETEDGGFEYSDANLAVLRGLDQVMPRPDYYLIGDYNPIEPVTDYDVLSAWSAGFLTTAAAVEMLELEEGDTIEEIALQFDVPLPYELTLSPLEAALILEDKPVRGDPTFMVRRRIRDGRLASYFPSDVKACRVHEGKVENRSQNLNPD